MMLNRIRLEDRMRNHELRIERNVEGYGMAITAAREESRELLQLASGTAVFILGVDSSDDASKWVA